MIWWFSSDLSDFMTHTARLQAVEILWIVIRLSCWWWCYCIDTFHILSILMNIQPQLNSSILIFSLPCLMILGKVSHLCWTLMTKRTLPSRLCNGQRDINLVPSHCQRTPFYAETIKKLTHLGLSDSVVKVIGGEITINTFCTWSSAAFLNLCPSHYSLEANRGSLPSFTLQKLKLIKVYGWDTKPKYKMH